MAGSTYDRRRTWRIDDVLDRTDLSVLLDELATSTNRTGSGRRWHCPLPDHDDHRASVTMYRDRRGHERWRCWSGGHRGDAVDLVMTVMGRERADAVDWLAGRAGMTPDAPLPAVRKKRTPRQATPAIVMDPAVANYVDACRRVIATRGGRQVREWLRGRGLTDETITANRIGADPGRSLMRRQRGLPFGAGTAATFPIFDPNGNLAYVQSRYLDADAAGRKYDNPAASLAPNPRLGFAVSTVELRDAPLLLCEGMPDALTAAQAGFQSVGLLGAHAPDEAVAARLANHLDGMGTGHGIVLVTDPDPAGRRVAETLGPLLTGLGHEPAVVTPPDDLDLNEWSRSDPDWSERLHDQIKGLDPAGRGSEELQPER
ncbi:toprim domain-containing protein [Ilumatobacter nonamiensis]|uniref:toprim domain-containing protein n=1 Tax=Ilumatobacter nonamiensis TaxID=467093 RepID=UPI000685A5A4|nr:toprim domain-containing protein [Ilumatobacter nonamiensis]